MVKKTYNNLRLGVCSPSISNSKRLINIIKTKYRYYKINKKKILNGKLLINFLKNCDHAIIGLEKIDENIIDCLPRIKKISKLGVGLDNIDIQALKKKKIKFFFKKGINKRSVSELILFYIIFAVRDLYYQIANLKNGLWQKKIGKLFTTKKIGIIGYGNIGKDLAKLLNPFSVKIYINDLKRVKSNKKLIITSKKKIYKECDVICLTVPLTNLTKNLITKKELLQMKKNVVLINTSRGEIISEKEMIKFLKSHQSMKYCTDVFNNEPNINKKLLKLKNVLCTPHIGGSTEEDIYEFGKYTINIL